MRIKRGIMLLEKMPSSEFLGTCLPLEERILLVIISH